MSVHCYIHDSDEMARKWLWIVDLEMPERPERAQCSTGHIITVNGKYPYTVDSS
jgi:hypothetical protein